MSRSREPSVSICSLFFPHVGRSGAGWASGATPAVTVGLAQGRGPGKLILQIRQRKIVERYPGGVLNEGPAAGLQRCPQDSRKPELRGLG